MKMPLKSKQEYKSDKPLGLGVIGVGALALRGIIPHMSQDDVQMKVRLRAVCDPAIDRARAVASEFKIAMAYQTIEELLADDNIDVVTIASPIGLHFEHCRLALNSGKHVHVNKTLCTKVSEADELIRLAQINHLRIVASPGEVLRPQIQRTRELIAAGAIGDLSWAICGGAFEKYHEGDETERVNAPGASVINPSWYFKKPGGGPMFDITVYALHQLTSILGPVLAVTAMSGIRINERTFLSETIKTEADDNTILLLDFGASRFAVVYGTAAGSVSDQFGAGIYFGTRGKIEGTLLNGTRFDFPGDEETLDYPVADWDAQMRVLPHVIDNHRAIPEAHVFEDIMQLVDWIQTGKQSLVTAEHARHVIDIIESGYKASETKITQAITTTFDF